MAANPAGPGLAGLVGPDVLEWIRREPLALQRPVWGRRLGHHASSRAGVGMEFRDHRPYVPGDDPRSLDWRAIARNDRLVLRQTETEDALDLVFMLDTGGGMAYGDGASRKHTVSRALVACLAWIAARQGDRVSLAWGGQGQADASLLQRGRGREPMHALTHALSRVEARGTCPWSDLLDETVPRLRQRSLLVVLSDFLDVGAGASDPETAEADLWRGLSHLRARGHDVLLLQVMHRDEIEFPWTDRRATEFVDVREIRDTVEAPGGSLRAAYLERLGAHLTELGSTCEQNGLALHRMPTDESLTAHLARILGRLAGTIAPQQDAP